MLTSKYLKVQFFLNKVLPSRAEYADIFMGSIIREGGLYMTVPSSNFKSHPNYKTVGSYDICLVQTPVIPFSRKQLFTLY